MAGAGQDLPLGTSEQEQPTDRRQALQAISALMSASYLESVEFTRRTEASDLGPATLQTLEEVVEQLGRDYLRTPPPQLFSEVHRWRQYVNRLLQGRHTLAQRRQLYAVAGWLSALLGHLCDDLGHRDAAETHCSTALRLAEEVGQAELTGWVRGSQALFATPTSPSTREPPSSGWVRPGWPRSMQGAPSRCATSRRRTGRLQAALRPYRALAAVGDLGDGFRALDSQQNEG